MVDVRTITDDEVPAWFRALATGFLSHDGPGGGDDRRRHLALDRTYGAFDGDRMVGTARSFATELTVPGGAAVPAAAVTNVTVSATHRRRGVLTEMMRRQLDEVAGRGELVAILVASEAPIYGRFGYGPATEHLLVELDASRARFAGPAAGGSVELVTAEELRAEAVPVYERFRAAQPGAIGRPDWWWDHALGLGPRDDAPPAPAFHAVRRDASGDVDGYARYRVDRQWDYRVPRAVLDLDELVALSDEAYAALWRFCAEVDWVGTVRAENRPPVEPLPQLLVDPRLARQRERADLLWVRLLDVAAALGARRYRGEGTLVLEVGDASRPASGGRFALEVGTGVAACAPTTAPPDLTLDAADLAAAYLGGTPLWPAAAAGRVGEHRPGAVGAFDALFLCDRPPWCHTWF